MQIIHILGQIMHLLVIAVAAAGPLLCIALNAKQLNRKDMLERDTYWMLGTTLSRHANVALIVGSVFGLIVAGIVWDHDFHQRCHVLKSRFIYLGIEWVFSCVLLLIAHLWWAKRPCGLRPFLFRPSLPFGEGPCGQILKNDKDTKPYSFMGRLSRVAAHNISNQHKRENSAIRDP